MLVVQTYRPSRFAMMLDSHQPHSSWIRLRFGIQQAKVKIWELHIRTPSVIRKDREGSVQARTYRRGMEILSSGSEEATVLCCGVVIASAQSLKEMNASVSDNSRI